VFGVRKSDWLLAIGFLIATASQSAKAIPAFAEQTQQPCQACHVGGFGPALTPFGRQFKMSGYTLRAGDAFTPPISAAVIASFVNTNKDQATPPAPHYATNNNVTIDQVNLFIAGGINDHFGGFSQFTYDGVGRGISWDNLDLRAVDNLTLWGSDVLVGLSLNNAPTVQDAWNSTPAWGFPYTSSALGPSPSASPLIAGAFAGNTLGTTAYAWWDSHIYTEAGLYWTPGNAFLRTFGASPDAGTIDGASPYFRAAYQQDFGDQNFEIGAFALFPDLHPPGVASAATDDYSDIGLDGSYQFMGSGDNIYTANARYTFEQQNLGASFGAGNAANAHDSLEDLRLDASYYWHNAIGVTLSPFDTWGSRDILLYAGNRTFTPNSSGMVFQTDYTVYPNSDSPFGQRFNMRVGLQYTAYAEFDGAGSNYDNAKHNASDNNTLRIFTWIAY
jgi:hypothetical protein